MTHFYNYQYHTLTYGMLPSYEIFEEQFNRYITNEDKAYRIRNDKLLGDSDLFCPDLYNILCNLTYNDKHLDWVSAVLFTLDIEWV